MTLIKINSNALATEHIGKVIEASFPYTHDGDSSRSTVYGRIDGISHDLNSEYGVVTTVRVRLDATQVYTAKFRGDEVHVADSTAEHLKHLVDAVSGKP